MGDRNDLPYIVIERHSSGIGPFFWGALLGATVALLIAPRSGAETQREIRDRVERLRGDAEDRIDEARSTLRTAVDRARTQVGDRIGTVRDAFETGRQAARDSRSDLRERLHEAKRAARAGSAPAAASMTEPAEIDVIVTDVVIEDSSPFDRE